MAKKTKKREWVEITHLHTGPGEIFVVQLYFETSHPFDPYVRFALGKTELRHLLKSLDKTLKKAEKKR